MSQFQDKKRGRSPYNPPKKAKKTPKATEVGENPNALGKEKIKYIKTNQYKKAQRQ